MKRLALCHTPTPIWHNRALDALLGFELWVKRDDMTSGAAAGNKIRKLEYLLADALAHGATTVVTCGGLQSNHARATALLARELGLESVLLLRTPDPAAPPEPVGNLLLDRLVGADVRLITPDQYRARAQLMDEVAGEFAARGRPAYLIPEGGSNGVGSFGYLAAVEELADQQKSGELPDDLDLLAVACGSGGTAAGVAVGLTRFVGVATRAAAFAVCDDRAYFEQIITRIAGEMQALDPTLDAPAALGVLDIYDEYKGPAYGVPTAEQLAFVVAVARTSGLVLEPTYTGKALFGLSRLPNKPRRALFIHTGGLPGLLAEAPLISGALARA
ncbi:MAG TPA: D-cysteine desulfhydrase family protein [Polyangiaceae bacterium]|nr:D-cysteine desulfhydrase family protein [Polyangiaceae bacterium]